MGQERGIVATAVVVTQSDIGIELIEDKRLEVVEVVAQVVGQFALEGVQFGRSALCVSLALGYLAQLLERRL